jgi:hypothetical protein
MSVIPKHCGLFLSILFFFILSPGYPFPTILLSFLRTISAIGIIIILRDNQHHRYPFVWEEKMYGGQLPAVRLIICLCREILLSRLHFPYSPISESLKWIQSFSVCLPGKICNTSKPTVTHYLQSSVSMLRSSFDESPQV